MADNKINVTVSANTRKNITVSSTQQSTEITASTDTGRFWSQVSKNWAVSENIVDNTDYSSKHYAVIAKESAENAQNIEEIVKNDYNAFLEASMTANTELQATKENAITEIESNKINAVDSMNAVKNDAVDSINSTKTTVLNDIEFVAEGEKKEIGELIDTGKDELKESIKDLKVLTTLKIGQIGIAPLGIDETLNMERYLNGQIIIQDQFKGFTNYLKRRVELYPSVACTEEEWQTEVTMSAFSQCGKFVIDDNAGTIRLPKVVNIQGLTDLSKLAEIIEAGLPNINGYVGGIAFDSNGTGASSGALKLVNSTLQTVNGHHLMDYKHTWKDIALNASLSNPIYGDSDTVQPESIQYPYFIQVATGAETEDNIVNEIELNNPFSLLDYKYSEYELNNLSWLRSEGQWNAKAIYPAVYDLLLKIYNGVETKAGVSVKLTTETFTDYDFVLNTAEETFRLQLKVKLASGKAVVGNGKALMLTNGTQTGALSACGSGAAGNVSGFLRPVNGADGINIGDTAETTVASMFNPNKAIGVVNDASKSGIETSDSGLYLYFYVGETVQNANLVNIGRIQEAVTSFIPNNSKSWDGQWVGRDYGIVSNTGVAANTSVTYDLSSYLPNDGYTYEVLFSLQAQTGATSGYEVNLSLGTDIAPGFIVTKGVTRASARIYCIGTATVPVGRARQVTIKQWSTYPCDIILLAAVCYRRIGTNL